jgi:hypothetical protein
MHVILDLDRVEDFATLPDEKQWTPPKVHRMPGGAVRGCPRIFETHGVRELNAL